MAPAAISTSASVEEIAVVEPAPRGPDRRRIRHLASAALGLGLGAIPVMAAFAAAVAAAQVVSPPSGAALLLWWISVFALSAVVAFGAQALLRRYFPLVGLLRLALAFPADVPSRLGLAMRAGTLRELEHRVIDIRDGVTDPELAAATVVAFAAALQRHDRFTRGHCERVRAYTDLLAAEFGVTKSDRKKLRWAALLHDIGKLEVPPSLLNKPGALDQDEWLEMREHAAAGRRLGEPLRVWLGEWVDGIGQHHERYDASGYPLGLAGKHISLAGRIVAVADSYETMTAARPYKKPMSHATARQELVASAGTHFDPAVVHAMLRLSVRRLRWAAGPFALLGDLLAARLIARGSLGRGQSLGAGRVLQVVATSAAAVATVSLGWTTAVTAAPAPSAERTVRAVADGDGNGATTDPTMSKSAPAQPSASPAGASSGEASPNPSAPSVAVTGEGVDDEPVAASGAPPVETAVAGLPSTPTRGAAATPAIAPVVGDGDPATPAVPAARALKETGRAHRK